MSSPLLRSGELCTTSLRVEHIYLGFFFTKYLSLLSHITLLNHLYQYGLMDTYIHFGL